MINCVKINLNREIMDNTKTVGKIEVTIYSPNNEKSNFGLILLEADSLELPYKENKKNISCIPAGKYKIEVKKNKIRVLDVPDRDGILIHKGNEISETEGCILIGELNQIYCDFLCHSKNFFDRLYEILIFFSLSGYDIFLEIIEFNEQPI